MLAFFRERERFRRERAIFRLIIFNFFAIDIFSFRVDWRASYLSLSLSLSLSLVEISCSVAALIACSKYAVISLDVERACFRILSLGLRERERERDRERDIGREREGERGRER
jgi:hypothetical protein